jgi:DNA-binding response OmpR family regulator
VSLAHRILVVEDEQVLAQNVKAYLGRHAADVRIARDGRHAIEMIASFTPDVVVLGYGLPGENGLQIYAEMMRHRARPIGCVMITGYPLEKIIQPANKLGIRYLLCKPFSLAELQQLIDRSAEEASRDWN